MRSKAEVSEGAILNALLFADEISHSTDKTKWSCDIISVDQRATTIGDQRIGELMPLAKVMVTFCALGTDPDNLDTEALELLILIAEQADLPRAEH